MGRDQIEYHKSVLLQKFQPTRPHGARLYLVMLLSLTLRFNPRARMGRDNCL